VLLVHQILVVVLVVAIETLHQEQDSLEALEVVALSFFDTKMTKLL
jgi:hypothetical protein